jgi:cullin 1
LGQATVRWHSLHLCLPCTKHTYVHVPVCLQVKGNYGVSYDLQVTTLQALTLLVFNRRALDVSWLALCVCRVCGLVELPYHCVQVSFDELRAALNVDEEVMKRLLHSLSCGKYQVIVKEPAGRTINIADRFSFNASFTCPLRKIRIPMASLDDTHNPQRVEEDRSIAIEAAIVCHP